MKIRLRQRGVASRFAAVAVVVCALAFASIAILRPQAWSDTVVRSSTPSPVFLREIHRIPLDSSRPGGETLTRLAWSPDGSRLAVVFDWGWQVVVLNTSTWKEVSRIGGRSFDPEREAAFLSNSEIVTSPAVNVDDSPSALAIYDSETGSLRREIPRSPEFPGLFTTRIAVTSSRKFVGTEAIREPLLYDVETGRFIGRLGTPKDSSTHRLAGGPGDKLAVDVNYYFERASRAIRKEIYLIDAATNRVERILAGHRPRVGAIAWSSDGQLIASGSMETGDVGDPLTVWNPATGGIVASFDEWNVPISHISWHPASAVLATDGAKGGGDRGSAVRLWSVPRKTMLFEFKTPDTSMISAVSFDPVAGRLAWGWRGALQVFEVVGLSD